MHMGINEVLRSLLNCVFSCWFQIIYQLLQTGHMPYLRASKAAQVQEKWLQPRQHKCKKSGSSQASTSARKVALAKATQVQETWLQPRPHKPTQVQEKWLQPRPHKYNRSGSSQAGAKVLVKWFQPSRCKIAREVALAKLVQSAR